MCLSESMIYVGQNNSTRMICFIFEADFHGNPRITLSPRIINSRLIKTINQPQDVNTLLESNPELKAEMQELVEKYKI